MGSVASSLHCDASNITGIIDRLVAQGLVTRRESQQDRRAKLLQLTAKGHKIIERITAKLPAQLGCDKLSAVERQDLHTLIMRLV
jgi:DNA-binding MarR family transcriptional regulator